MNSDTVRAKYLIVKAVVVFSCGNVLAEEPSNIPIQICIGAFTADALDPEVASEAKTRIINELSALGVSFLSSKDKVDMEINCIETPKCLLRTVSGHGVAGVLDVRVFRFGPMVRVSIRTFDASTGEKVLETETIASAEGFPKSASLTKDLERVLEALRKQRPATKVESENGDEKQISTTEIQAEEKKDKEKYDEGQMELLARLAIRYIALKENAKQQKPTVQQQKLTVRVKEEIHGLDEKATFRMHTYEKWGHITF